MPKIVLLINYGSKYDELNRKIKHNENVRREHDLGSYAQGQGCIQVRRQNRFLAITQKLLKQIYETSQKDRT